jgi:release factor glutamine methyltransferase
MNNLTYFEALKWASLFIQEHQGDENAPQILMMDMMEWTKTNLIMHYRDTMPTQMLEKFQQAIHRIANGEPVQYVTHQAMFFGRTFYVDDRVLIPRIDTEELIEAILAKTATIDRPLRVLDIGTGSGDIAITLKLERPTWQVTASDISADALAVAKQNAQTHQAIIDFRLGSLFEPVAGEQFDLIISNPPYIADDEKNEMDASVIEFEPHQALFADDDGLFWYKRIADQLEQYLTTNGQVLCEIGYRQGAALKTYFAAKSVVDQVDIIQDMTQHDRILWAKRK